MLKKLIENTNVQRVGALVIGIAVLAYTVYHVASLFGEDISTIPTGITKETTVIDGKGYIFRDETPLYSTNNGVADYYKTDGSKVSVGEALASVYQRGSKQEKQAVSYLDQRIEILSRSVESGYTLADLPEINDNISDSYYALAKMMASGDMGGVSEEADKLLLNMNCHDLLTAEDSPVDNTLDSMIKMRDGVLSSSGNSIVEYATESGYFYSSVDGYETNFTVEAADSLTAKDYYKLISVKNSLDTGVLNNAYGKLAESNEWRFVVRLPSTTAGYFKLDGEYQMEFVENGYKKIPMTLLSSVEDTEYGGQILVFRANRLPAGFVFDRCQSVSVEVSTRSGIYIPRSAVHRVSGDPCVYVLKGSVVCVRRIEIVYEAKDYYLAAVEPESDKGAPYLDINELMIVGGSNLFDGRILD